MKSQAETLTALRPVITTSGKRYAKFLKIRTRPAVVGEAIVTVTSDGKETASWAGSGDLIVENQTSAKEQYILAAVRVQKRYKNPVDVGGGWTEWTPCGEVLRVEYHGETFEFGASWKDKDGNEEKMVCKDGDSLVMPYEGDDGDTLKEEVYRIAAKEFTETYALKG